MPETEKTENLEKDISPSGSSEQAAGLEGLRGRAKHNVFMETSDFENAILDQPGEDRQADREAANAEEEKKAEVDSPAEEEPSTKIEDAPTKEKPVEVDADLDALQKKLFASDADRAKLRQDIAESKSRVAELDPYIQLGYAISQDAELLAAVRQRLAGGTKKEKKASAADVSSPEFQNSLRTMMREEIGTAIGTHVEANRKLNTYDAKAKKELSNFDLISKHPDYLAHLTVWNDLVQAGKVNIPAELADEPEYFAMKQAYNTMLQSNPDYQAAAEKVATKKAKANLEKKALAASVGGGSKIANAGERTLTAEEKDRVGMIKAFRGFGRSRRIPGAR